MIIEEIIAKHVLSGEFKTSEGLSTTYYDVVSAIIKHPHLFRTYFLQHIEGLWPVGAGASGALILGVLGREGSLWRAPKGYGLDWHNLAPPGARVALVDDSAFTGTTLKQMRAACEKAALIVVKEVVVVDKR